MPGLDHPHLISLVIEGVIKRVELDARDAEHGIHTVLNQRIHHGFAASFDLRGLIRHSILLSSVNGTTARPDRNGDAAAPVLANPAGSCEDSPNLKGTP